MPPEITEFTWIEPDEVHLVGRSANGFPAPLLAKAAEALDDVLGAPVYSEDRCVKYVSAEARRKYAKSGVAMPNGDFPIPDEGHLHSAIGHLGNYNGDKGAAKTHIIKRARALGLTHLLPEDWHVSKEDAAAKQTAPDKALPTGEAGSQTAQHVEGDPTADTPPDNEDGGDARHVAAADERPPHGDGQGDTAPDKALPVGEAGSQTAGAQKAEEDALEKGRARLAEVVRAVTEREKAEEGASKATRRIISGIEYTAERPELLKGMADMPNDELIKALGELGAARQKAEKAAKKAKKEKAEKAAKKEAEEAAKREAEAAKAAEEAAKAADGTAAPDDSALTKALDELNELKEKVEKMASEDGKHVVLNGAGVAAILRGPEKESVFKALEDRIANAATPDEERLARQQLATAKAIAQDNARRADPTYMERRRLGLGEPILTNRHELTHDRDLQAV